MTEDLQDPEYVEKTRRIALDLLAVRDRTVKEMGDRLVRRGRGQESIDVVIEGLLRSGLLDDEKFVRQWVGSRLEHRPEGRIKLLQDLRKRGVDRSLAERILEEFGDRVGSDEGADRVIERVLHRYQGQSPDAARRRLYGLLARRGFDPDTCRAAVERAMEQIQESAALKEATE